MSLIGQQTFSSDSTPNLAASESTPSTLPVLPEEILFIIFKDHLGILKNVNKGLKERFFQSVEKSTYAKYFLIFFKEFRKLTPKGIYQGAKWLEIDRRQDCFFSIPQGSGSENSINGFKTNIFRAALRQQDLEFVRAYMSHPEDLPLTYREAIEWSIKENNPPVLKSSLEFFWDKLDLTTKIHVMEQIAICNQATTLSQLMDQDQINWNQYPKIYQNILKTCSQEIVDLILNYQKRHHSLPEITLFDKFKSDELNPFFHYIFQKPADEDQAYKLAFLQSVLQRIPHIVQGVRLYTPKKMYTPPELIGLTSSGLVKSALFSPNLELRKIVLDQPGIHFSPDLLQTAIEQSHQNVFEWLLHHPRIKWTHLGLKFLTLSLNCASLTFALQLLKHPNFTCAGEKINDLLMIKMLSKNHLELIELFQEHLKMQNWILSNEVFEQAFKKNQPPLIQLLIEHPPQPCKRKQDGFLSRALIQSVREKNYEMVAVLATSKNIAEETLAEALKEACEEQDLLMVQCLFNHPNLDLNFGNFALYDLVLKSKNLDFIRSLFEKPSIHLHELSVRSMLSALQEKDALFLQFLVSLSKFDQRAAMWDARVQNVLDLGLLQEFPQLLQKLHPLLLVKPSTALLEQLFEVPHFDLAALHSALLDHLETLDLKNFRAYLQNKPSWPLKEKDLLLQKVLEVKQEAQQLLLLFELLKDPRLGFSMETETLLSKKLSPNGFQEIRGILREYHVGELQKVSDSKKDLYKILKMQKFDFPFLYRWAILRGEKVLAKVLMKKFKADLQEDLEDGLHWATLGGQTGLVKTFLKTSSIPAILSALEVACEQGSQDIAEMIFNRLKKEDYQGKLSHLLISVASHGYLPLIKLIGVKDLYATETIHEALLLASVAGHAAVVEYLVTTLKADPHGEDCAALRWATLRKQYVVVSYLSRQIGEEKAKEKIAYVGAIGKQVPNTSGWHLISLENLF